MANKTTKSKTVANKGAARRAAAKAPGAGKTAPKSQSRKPAKPGRAGGKPRVAKTGGDARGTAKPASRLIDERIRDLGGWRAVTLARMRALILEADPEMTEEWKWRGTPVWSRHGIVCTGEAYTKVVKLTFARGASIPDPAGLFNASLEGNTRRALDIHEGEQVDAAAFKALVKAAVAENGSRARGKAKPGARGKPPAGVPRKSAGKSRSPLQAGAPVKVRKSAVLLAGGNPQIAKADGDAPVQAYIAAMPGWKRAVGRRLDALIARTVPGVRKAVRWNSPFYGVEGHGWFLNFHCFTKYVKVAFFRGTSLRPVPPGESRHEDVRYLDIHEDDRLDEAQLAAWVKQASQLPGWGKT